MTRDISDYINDILNECDYLISRTQYRSFDEFQQSEDLKKAFVRSLEIIGEASKKIPDKIKSEYPQIKWKNISGMRDVLIHDYFGVNYEVVWKTVKERIPELSIVVQNISKKMQ